MRLERAEDFAGCPHGYADTVSKGHGRIASRRCWTTGDPDLLSQVAPDQDGRDLAGRVRVESKRRGGDRATTDIRVFIAGLPPKTKLLLQTVRRHGSIENARPWVMDVALGEAASRIRTGQAAHNMAIPGASPTSGWRRPGTRTVRVG